MAKVKSILVVLFILFLTELKAQKIGDINIGVGVGDYKSNQYSQFSDAAGFFYNAEGVLPPGTSSSYLPVYNFYSNSFNLYADYQITYRSALGLAGCYQYCDVSRYAYSSYYQNYRGEKISRTNLSLRYLFSIGYTRVDSITPDALELLIGGRIGVSYWTDVPYNGFLLKPGTINNNYIQNPFYIPSLQILILLRLYLFAPSNIPVLKDIGVHIEGGLGCPDFFELGLNYRIATRKKK